jgi:hypothetical protein
MPLLTEALFECWNLRVLGKCQGNVAHIASYLSNILNPPSKLELKINGYGTCFIPMTL